MVFSGKSAPPPEVATEADVLAMVGADPAAIGYVSDECHLEGREDPGHRRAGPARLPDQAPHRTLMLENLKFSQKLCSCRRWPASPSSSSWP